MKTDQKDGCRRGILQTITWSRRKKERKKERNKERKREREREKERERERKKERKMNNQCFIIEREEGIKEKESNKKVTFR